MSLSATLDLQKSLFAALKSHAALQTLMGGEVRIYDQIPEKVVFPYIALQRTQSWPLTADASGEELALSLMVVSRFGGSEEVKAIAATLRTFLDAASLSLEAHRLINVRVSFVDVFRSSDLHNYYALLRVRAVAAPLSE